MCGKAFKKMHFANIGNYTINKNKVKNKSFKISLLYSLCYYLRLCGQILCH